MEAGLLGFALLLAMAFAGIHLGVAMFITGFFGFAFLRGLDASVSLAGALIFEASLSYGFALLPLFLLMRQALNRDLLTDQIVE